MFENQHPYFKRDKQMKQIFIYDTTLRDGSQGENINFSVDEKIQIARRLDRTGIHFIEGGWPGANPKDSEFFNKIQKENFKNARVVAFGSTRKPGKPAAYDSNLNALLASETHDIAIFGKSWTLHVQEIMKNTLTENLSMIRDSIEYLTSHNRNVCYDAEHFFDGYLASSEYAIETLTAAMEGGAQTITLCDTNGGLMLHDVARIVSHVKSHMEAHFPKVRLGVHVHNDCGLAVANSVTAIQAGATLVQGTINGYGERCGNADLINIIPLLAIKLGYSCIDADQLRNLKNLSRFVSETANMIPLSNRPFVGESAFAHKGGIHVSAIKINPKSYEHMDPKWVGNSRDVLISDLAGKSNIDYKANEFNIHLPDETSLKISQDIKKLEKRGYKFEGADGSLKLLMQKHLNRFQPAFELESFRVFIEKTRIYPVLLMLLLK
ncbi:MAG: 2-isopropylmalate synthase [Candidatus Magnetoglobus multicellularis str. Araruama]|uniref:Citramalate synthase n=1 Tax=Candidatus Magnetoglobus multicellularis str. Araruama TaxID=890399 RepID=A0A1V1PEI0_9BACT|nr:MAG: 2-isopropylmalate synthase [Candidatus Magnetoglobus multicellularis str. Araruama]